jgi:hypothetical protein
MDNPANAIFTQCKDNPAGICAMSGGTVPPPATPPATPPTSGSGRACNADELSRCNCPASFSCCPVDGSCMDNPANAIFTKCKDNPASTCAMSGGTSPGTSTDPSPGQSNQGPAGPRQRTFLFVNRCSQPVYVGAQGNPLPGDGGWKMDPGATVPISAPDNLSAARFWGRTGCGYDGNGHLVCATGDCPLPAHLYTATNHGERCSGIGGLPPFTLAEFTLRGAGGNDFYDLSLVDGYNVPMRVEPIQGTANSAANLSATSGFNCGRPTINGFDYNRCPAELRLADAAGQNLACMSVCTAVNRPSQVSRYPVLGGYDKSLVCCACDCGPNCGCDNPACRFGCSPFDPNPANRGGKCYVESWPRASDGQRYDRVFKDQWPTAYSWQFDDEQSTYQCRDADYRITFCP